MERNIIFVIFVFSCLPDGSKVNCNHVNAFPPGDSSLCCGILLLVSFCVGKPSKTCRPRPQFWINLSAGSRHHRPRQIRPRTHHHKTQINQSMETCGEFVFVVYILDFQFQLLHYLSFFQKSTCGFRANCLITNLMFILLDQTFSLLSSMAMISI